MRPDMILKDQHAPEHLKGSHKQEYMSGYGASSGKGGGKTPKNIEIPEGILALI